MAHKKDIQWTRRQFLQGLAAAPVVLTFPSESDAQTEPQQNRRIPMMQTWTDETSALVVILGAAGWTFKAATGSNIQVKIAKTQNISGTNQVLYRLEIAGLRTDAYNQFSVFDSGNKLLETRSLKGLDLQAPSPEIAVASCANYRKIKNQNAIYAQLEHERPDLMLFIGDIVYSNSQISSIVMTPENPSSALERYVTTWNTVNMYQLEPLIPTLAVWDDHDYGANNGDATHPYKSEMQEIFRSFYPLPSAHSRLSFGPGVSFRLRAFGLDLYMMDGRSHYVKGQTEWGVEQEAWFSQDYNQSTLPAWILNGMQFFRYFFTVESLEKNAEPSLQMLQNLMRTKRKPTALFSGDVHCSQIQEISAQFFGYKTYEITSSGIHCNSAGQAMKRKDDPGQIFYHGQDNFLMIKPSAQHDFMDLDIRCTHGTGSIPVSAKPLRIAV
jgi:hypothetical protein